MKLRKLGSLLLALGLTSPWIHGQEKKRGRGPFSSGSKQRSASPFLLPDNQQTDPVTIDLKGGQSAKVTLNAK